MYNTKKIYKRLKKVIKVKKVKIIFRKVLDI